MNFGILFLYISICFCFEQMILSSRKNCFLNLINLYRQHFLEQVLICLDCLPLFTAAATFTASPVDVFKKDSLLRGCNDQVQTNSAKVIWSISYGRLYGGDRFEVLVVVSLWAIIYGGDFRPVTNRFFDFFEIIVSF